MKTREVLIAEAARKVGDSPFVKKFFILGAEWADKNPVCTDSALKPELDAAYETIDALKAELAAANAQISVLSAGTTKKGGKKGTPKAKEEENESIETNEAPAESAEGENLGGGMFEEEN